MRGFGGFSDSPESPEPGSPGQASRPSRPVSATRPPGGTPGQCRGRSRARPTADPKIRPWQFGTVSREAQLHITTPRPHDADAHVAVPHALCPMRCAPRHFQSHAKTFLRKRRSCSSQPQRPVSQPKPHPPSSPVASTNTSLSRVSAAAISCIWGSTNSYWRCSMASRIPGSVLTP